MKPYTSFEKEKKNTTKWDLKLKLFLFIVEKWSWKGRKISILVFFLLFSWKTFHFLSEGSEWLFLFLVSEGGKLPGAMQRLNLDIDWKATGVSVFKLIYTRAGRKYLHFNFCLILAKALEMFTHLSFACSPTQTVEVTAQKCLQEKRIWWDCLIICEKEIELKQNLFASENWYFLVTIQKIKFKWWI